MRSYVRQEPSERTETSMPDAPSGRCCISGPFSKVVTEDDLGDADRLVAALPLDPGVYPGLRPPPRLLDRAHPQAPAGPPVHRDPHPGTPALDALVSSPGAP